MVRRLDSRLLRLGFSKSLYRLSDGLRFLAGARLIARFFEAGAGFFRLFVFAVSFAAGLRPTAARLAAERRVFVAAFRPLALGAAFVFDFGAALARFRGFDP